MGGAPTFTTNTDFQHPGAKTVSSWHTEALVGGVLFRAHEYVLRGREAVSLDAFHIHIFHICQMYGPRKRERFTTTSADVTIQHVVYKTSWV